MTNHKYDKNLIPAPLEPGNFAPVVRFSSKKHLSLPLNFTMVRNSSQRLSLWIKAPTAMILTSTCSSWGPTPGTPGIFERRLSSASVRKKKCTSLPRTPSSRLPEGLRHCPLTLSKLKNRFSSSIFHSRRNVAGSRNSGGEKINCINTFTNMKRSWIIQVKATPG